MNNIIFVGKHNLTTSVTKHIHQSVELIYCTSGEGELVFQNGVLQYGTDSVVVIPAMLPHSNRSGRGFTNIHINMTDSTLNYREPVILHADSTGFLRQAFDAAFYYYSNNGVGRAMVLPAYGQLIVTTIQAYDAVPAHTDVVQQILDHILKNYTDVNYDLNAFLVTLPFSFEYLKKMFKSEIGMTPRQYLTEKRLENAASNLARSAGSSNISQIARQSGFHEPLYFSRLFKKKYGVSPKNYAPELQEPPNTDSDSTKIIL